MAASDKIETSLNQVLVDLQLEVFIILCINGCIITLNDRIGRFSPHLLLFFGHTWGTAASGMNFTAAALECVCRVGCLQPTLHMSVANLLLHVQNGRLSQTTVGRRSW
jgi:hypothetical protein